MRKAAIITLTIFASTFFMSCANTHTASNSYFGAFDKKAAKKRQKEFAKPKHKIATEKCSKGGK